MAFQLPKLSKLLLRGSHRSLQRESGQRHRVLLWGLWCLMWFPAGVRQFVPRTHLQPAAASCRLKQIFLSAHGNVALLSKADLNNKIQSAKSPGDILELLEVHAGSADCIHLSLGLYEIAKRRDKVTPHVARLQDFVQCLEYECPSMNPRSLSLVAWAATQLNSELDMTGLAAAAASATAMKIDSVQPRDLSSTVWSLAKVRVAHKGLLDAAAAHASERIKEFNALNLGNLVYGFAAVGEKRPGMMSKVARQVRICLHEMNIQLLCNIAWGFARLDVRDEPMMHDIAKTVAKQTPCGKMKWVDWGTLFLAFASLDVHSETLIDACVADLSIPELHASNHWSICALSTACSKLKGGKKLAGLRREVEGQVRRRGITEAELRRDFLDPSTWTRSDNFMRPQDFGRF